jgi:hypothetical protein
VGHHGSRLLVVVALVAATWLAYAELYLPSGAKPLAWRTATIERLQLPRPTVEVFRSRSELDSFLAELTVVADPPPLDFERELAVLLALGPRSSAGYRIGIVRVEQQRGRVFVVARELSRPGAAARVDYPSVLVLVLRTEKPVAVDWEE